MRRFEYFTPPTVEEACLLLNRYGAEAKIIAGGTDLLVSIKDRKLKPRYLIGLKSIKSLADIKWDESSGLSIGPLATLDSIADCKPIKERFEALSMAALKIGTPQIRNMGTIGGNICNASPSADTIPSLLALNAKLKLVSSKRERVVAIVDFFSGPFQAAREADELLVEIQIPAPSPGSTGCYKWLTKRTEVSETLVGVAVLMTLDRTNGVCNDIRLGLCSVAPTPMRARQAEDFLRGKKIGGELIKKAAALAAGETSPRSMADYRRKMTEVLVARAINEALPKAKL